MLWIKDHLLALVEQYGVVALFVAITLETLGLPLPGETALIASSAAAGAGKLGIWQVVIAAFVAAILGDNIGYLIGRSGAPLLDRLSARHAKQAALIARARALVARRGGLGVFFSTWLVAPLGPYVNFIAGASGLGWLRFLLWDAAGEAIWVGGYITLGYVFADQLAQVADIAANASGFLAAAAVALGLGLLLRARVRRARARAGST